MVERSYQTNKASHIAGLKLHLAYGHTGANVIAEENTKELISIACSFGHIIAQNKTKQVISVLKQNPYNAFQNVTTVLKITQHVRMDVTNVITLSSTIIFHTL